MPDQALADRVDGVTQRLEGGGAHELPVIGLSRDNGHEGAAPGTT